MRFYRNICVAVVVLAASPVHAEDSGPGESDGLSDRTAGYVEAALAELWEGWDEDVKAECSLAGEGRQVEGGVELTVTLDCGPGRVFEETREATAASAASMARSIGRGLLEERALARGERNLHVRISHDGISAEKPVFDRRKALTLSFVPMTLLIGVGVTMNVTAVKLLSSNESEQLFAGGIVTSGLALLFGPSIGWLYLGRRFHAWMGAGGRLLMAGATVGFLGVYFNQGCRDAQSVCGEDDYGDDSGGDDMFEEKFWFSFVVMSAATTVTMAILDAALVGGAADVENDRRREASNKPQVSFAPVPLVTPSGRTVPGAMMGVSF